MTAQEVIREVMNLRGWSQQKLAEEAEFKYQSNVSNILNSNAKGVRMDNLLRLLTPMGCEIIIRDKMGSKKEWVVDDNPAPPPKSLEEQLVDGEITFEQAVAKGWKPSPEMLSRMLGGDTK